ncbi:MAG: hypothetical protein K8R91_02685, partial [Phycisphaerae bacterium]|nr:hypothetical protein [Phycisphaerae bacterium]
RHLMELNIIDEVVAEPLGGAHRDPAEATANVERYFVRAIRDLRKFNLDDLLQRRYDRWRKMGKVAKLPAPQPVAVEKK